MANREEPPTHHKLDRDFVDGHCRSSHQYGWSTYKKQKSKLQALSLHTFKLWEWLQQIQFEEPVFGELIVECSIKDPKYVDHIESLFQKNTMTSFTVQTGDLKRLWSFIFIFFLFFYFFFNNTDCSGNSSSSAVTSSPLPAMKPHLRRDRPFLVHPL